MSGTSSAEGSSSRGDLDGGEHARLEEIAGIVKFHPHSGRAGFFVHVGIDVGDAPAKLAVGQIGKRDRRFLAEFEIGQVLLVNLRLHPDQCRGPPAGKSSCRRPPSGLRRPPSRPRSRPAGATMLQRLARLAGALQFGDLCVGDVEEFELGQRAGLERSRCRRGLGRLIRARADIRPGRCKVRANKFRNSGSPCITSWPVAFT